MMCGHVSEDIIGEQQKNQQRLSRFIVPGTACQNHAAQESEIYRNMEKYQTERKYELIYFHLHKAGVTLHPALSGQIRVASRQSEELSAVGYGL